MMPAIAAAAMPTSQPSRPGSRAAGIASVGVSSARGSRVTGSTAAASAPALAARIASSSARAVGKRSSGCLARQRSTMPEIHGGIPSRERLANGTGSLMWRPTISWESVPSKGGAPVSNWKSTTPIP